jgi:flavin-binding protein dodecin
MICRTRMAGPPCPGTHRTNEDIMAKKRASISEGVYRVIDVIGTSTVSWEDAANNAVATASKSLRDLRIAEVTQLDMKVEDGKVVAYRSRVQLSFKYQA